MENESPTTGPPLRCPGSARPDFLKATEKTCPRCGYAVEIWSDEPVRLCSSCGTLVCRDLDESSCINWCPAASICFKDVKPTQKALPSRDEKARAEDLLRRVKEALRKRA